MEGIRATTTVKIGDPRSSLLPFVHENNIDYMFFGSRGLSSVTGFFFGSVSQYALHNCPCTSVFVKEQQPITTRKIQNFGIFYDFSPSSEVALNQALQLLKTQGILTLHLCICVERPPTDSPWDYHPDEANMIEEKNKRNAETKLEVTKKKIHEAGVDGVIYVKVGDPRSWINLFVEEAQIDILFFGSRGHSTELSGFFVGSSSQYALHNCVCTIAVAKQK